MKFVDNAGNDVNDADVRDHKFLFLRLEEGDNQAALKTAQPDAGWDTISGNTVIAYHDALEWASAAAFGSIDTNGDGVLSRAELGAAVKAANPKASEEEVSAFVESVEGDGDVSLEQFVMAMLFRGPGAAKAAEAEKVAA